MGVMPFCSFMLLKGIVGDGDSTVGEEFDVIARHLYAVGGQGALREQPELVQSLDSAHPPLVHGGFALDGGLFDVDFKGDV